jgi:hypothetical protein
MATRTQSAQIDKLAKAYILQCIDGSNYGIVFSTEADKIKFLADTFKKEYGHHLRYYKSWQITLANWIMGLPSSFNIDFKNYRIIEIAKEWGSISKNATDKQEDKILDNWYNFIAAKTMQLFSKHGITL